MTWPTARLVALRRRVLAPLLRMRIDGAEDIPSDGALIVAANHRRRQLDPLMLAVATPRRTTFVSARDLRGRPLVRLAGFFGDVLYVAPDIPSLMAFRRRCQHVLARDGTLVIFPEGATMGDGDGVFRHGAAYLSLCHRAPVLPVWIERRGRRNTVRFGRPIPAPAAPVNRTTLAQVTQAIRAAIVALRSEETGCDT